MFKYHVIRAYYHEPSTNPGATVATAKFLMDKSDNTFCSEDRTKDPMLSTCFTTRPTKIKHKKKNINKTFCVHTARIISHNTGNKETKSQRNKDGHSRTEDITLSIPNSYWGHIEVSFLSYFSSYLAFGPNRDVSHWTLINVGLRSPGLKRKVTVGPPLTLVTGPT